MERQRHVILSDLPSEAWRLFGQFLTGYELLRLCLTCPKLRLLICHRNGCDSFRLTAHYNMHFPVLALQMSGLRNLTIKFPKRSNEHRILRGYTYEMLKALPPTLTSLHIDAMNSLFPFVVAWQNVRLEGPGGRDEPLDYLYTFNKATHSTPGEPVIVNIGEVLPKLRKLRLLGAVSSAWAVELASALPPTVTSVHLQVIARHNDPDKHEFLGSLLPPDLVKFSFYEVLSSGRLLKPRFAHLASLETLLLPTNRLAKNEDFTELLCPSLTCLKLLQGWNPVLSELAARHLKHLKHLEVNDEAPINAECFFPNTLTRLRLITNTHKVPIELLERLPAGMLHLETTFPTVWRFTGLPRGLRQLKFSLDRYTYPSTPPFDAEQAPQLFSGLPPKLEHLRIANLPRFIPACLPNTVTSFNSHLLIKNKQVDLCSILPTALTSLQMEFYRQYSAADLSSDDPFQYVISLPSQLKTLEVNMRDSYREPADPRSEQDRLNRSILGKLLPMLPSTLTSLSVTDTRHVSDTCISQLPLGLRFLRLVHFTGKGASLGFTSAGLKNLPKGLTNLQLSLNSDVDASAFFPFLPRFLDTLDFNRLERIKDSDFADLPRTLTNLALSPAKDLTDQCIALLPLSVTEFTCKGSTHFTPQLLKLLPPRLDRLDIRSTRNFPKSTRATLPPWLAVKTKTMSTSNF